MRFKQNGNKREIVALVCKNAEASSAIAVGQPVCLNGFNATDDGLGVVLPSTAQTNFSNYLDLIYGVALNPIAAGGFGECQVFGFTSSLLLTRQTRSASTAVWLTQDTVASFTPLVPETNANGWISTVAQSFVTASTAAANAALSHVGFRAMLASSVASFASSASATSDTRTAITTMVKAFLRLL